MMCVLYCVHGVIIYTLPLKELWQLCVGLVVVCLSQSHYLYSRRNLSSLLYAIEGNKPGDELQASYVYVLSTHHENDNPPTVYTL